MNLKNNIQNRIFFIHGGPGFNSVAESKILTPYFDSLSLQSFFFNERSPANFTALCEQVESDFSQLKWDHVHVIAHSFALFATLSLLNKESAKISKLTLLAPPTDPQLAYRNILHLALNDFKKQGSDAKTLVDKLEEKIGQNHSFYDEAMQEGFTLAAQDPFLFQHYWTDPERLTEFFGIWQEKGQSVNLESFHQVLLDLRKHLPELCRPQSIPTQIIYGSNDPIIHFSEQNISTLKLFPNAQHFIFEKSAHFPHLEEIDSFLTRVMHSF